MYLHIAESRVNVKGNRRVAQRMAWKVGPIGHPLPTAPSSALGAFSEAPAQPRACPILQSLTGYEAASSKTQISLPGHTGPRPHRPYPQLPKPGSACCQEPGSRTSGHLGVRAGALPWGRVRARWAPKSGLVAGARAGGQGMPGRARLPGRTILPSSLGQLTIPRGASMPPPLGDKRVIKLIPGLQ